MLRPALPKLLIDEKVWFYRSEQALLNNLSYRIED